MKNSIFMVEGYGYSQEIILGLNKKYKIYLKSGTKKINLLVTEICIGDFELTQAILKPEIELEAGIEYTMFIDCLPSYENLARYNETLNQMEPVTYEILSEKDIDKPIVDNNNQDEWKTSLTRLRSLNFITVDLNGSIYIALENFSIGVRQDRNHTFTTYFYGPVVMMKFDAESEKVYQNFVVKTNKLNERELTSVTGFVQDGKFIVNAQNSLFILDENFSIIECLYLTDFVENNKIRKKNHLWIMNFILKDQKSIVSFFKKGRKLHTLRLEI